ncbi:MAG: endonuclease [Actinomycetia bacterium]|nr:endonuclease [Actinomycetes bacterium]
MCGEATPADEVPVESLWRLEGASDPGDMAAVVAITCPHCDAKDVLVLRYGPEASAADSDVLLALPEPPAPT